MFDTDSDAFDDGKTYQLYEVGGPALPEVYIGFAPDDIDPMAYFKCHASPGTSPKYDTELGHMKHEQRGANRLWVKNGKSFKGLTVNVIQTGMTRRDAFAERNRLRASMGNNSISGPMNYDHVSKTAWSIKNLITPKQQAECDALEAQGFKQLTTIGTLGVEDLHDGRVTVHYHKRYKQGGVFGKVVTEHVKVQSDGSKKHTIKH